MAIKGFFKDQIVSPNCGKCGLNKGCKTPKMGHCGGGATKTLIITSHPSKSEDRQGQVFTGDTGEFLFKALDKLDLHLDDDFWSMPAVNCHTSKDNATNSQVKYCRPMVTKAVADLKPKVIVLMGAEAIRSYFGEKFSDTSPARWRGLCIPDVDNNAWVVPLLDPSLVIKKENDKHLRKLVQNDLKFMSMVIKDPDEIVPYRPEKNVIQLLDADKIVSFLDRIRKEKPLSAYDYETSALKPYNQNQWIWSMSLAAEGDTHGYSWPMQYPINGKYPCEKGAEMFFNKKEREAIEDAVAAYLEDGKCKKVAHNDKFEKIWGDTILDCETRGLIWCTMTNQHILDERKKFISLKFQSFIRWGVYGYEKATKPYFKDGARGNEWNTLHKCPINTLLLYGGIDSIVTLKLYFEQVEEFVIGSKRTAGLNNVRNLFHKGNQALAESQMHGINMNVEFLLDKEERSKKEIRHIEDMIRQQPEVRRYEKEYGKELDLNSNDDLRDFFYKILEIESIKLTDSGEDSVDKDVLAEYMHIPFVKMLADYRKLDKIIGTYIAQLKYEINDDGRLRPFLDLYTTRTGRSSSNKPNFQNIPVRSEEGKDIRKAFIPSKGNRILENDYGSVEVRLAACHTKDPVLIAYIEDESTDMHRDEAKALFMFSDNDWKTYDSKALKEARFYAKNGWVFPQFYGSYYRKCAQNLHNNAFDIKLEDGYTISDHLSDKGVKNYQDFEDHCKQHEKAYWKKFTVFKEWQEWVVDFYLTKGYVETKFGFRRRGLLSKNNVINSPIQGDAFMCLLWSYAEVNQEIKDREMKSRLMGQIHDCMLTDLVPEETDDMLRLQREIMTERIRKENPWIIVPLAVEPELTDVNQPWYYKETHKGDY